MKQLFIAILVSAIGTILVLGAHFMPSKLSMFTKSSFSYKRNSTAINQQYFDTVLHYHLSEPSFKKRVLTTKSIQMVKKSFALPTGTAFLLVNFIFLFICGVILFYLSTTFFDDAISSAISVFIFYLSPTIFSAFFGSNYSYDEPLQFLFLFLSYLFYRKERWAIFCAFYFMALLARESSLLLLPALALPFFQQKKWNKLLAYCLSPVLLFLIVQVFLFTSTFGQGHLAYQQSRFDLLHYNFSSFGVGAESLLSVFLVVGVATYYFITNRFIFSLERKQFLITLCINTVVVLCFAIAAESRLFALPLLFFWPIAAEVIKNIGWRNLHLSKSKILYLIVLAGIGIFASIAIDLKYYASFIPKKFHFQQEFIFLSLGIIFLLEVLRVLRSPKSLSQLFRAYPE